MKAEELKDALANWLECLEVEEEKSKNTLIQYSYSIRVFIDFVESNGIKEIDKKTLLAYKADLEAQAKENKLNPLPGRTQVKSNRTINNRLIALNRFFKDNGHPELTVRLEKDDTSNVLNDVLTENEYKRIIKQAEKMGRDRIKLIIETLASTGIRISELQFITVEALKSRKTEVTNKGKTRWIFIPKELAKKLKAYCKKNNIKTGVVFFGRKTKKDKDGNVILNKYGTPVMEPLDQSAIRKEFKEVTGKARGIKKSHAYPHALRHLFAKRYANMPGTNAYILPTLLGHSDKSVSVTNLYTKPSDKELLEAVDSLEAYYNNLDKKDKKTSKPKTRRNKRK